MKTKICPLCSKELKKNNTWQGFKKVVGPGLVRYFRKSVHKECKQEKDIDVAMVG